jgi:predicted TIM-barrel fold metal-dependent hydrolase
MDGVKKSEPDPPLESPIAFRPCSNGEFCPLPESERDRLAERRFREIVERDHRRAGMTRRQFVESACGTAAALAALNGCGGSGGAQVDAAFQLPPDATVDLPAACEVLDGDEFIFDVQVHTPSPESPWRDGPLPAGIESFVRTVFVGSDTDVACLSGIPDARNLGTANVEARDLLRGIIERAGGPRLQIHANVDPTRGASELDYMATVAGMVRVSAWKVYPHVGSWRLDRGVGLAFLERARALGIKLVAAHRGIGPGIDYAATSSPIDVALAAKMFPDVTFLTYHSGWDAAAPEDHPFDPAQENPVGIDRMVKAVLDNGLGRTGNVYAELGSTWRNLMGNPLAAQHAIGKLLLHVGEDRVIWGTDSVFTGSPQAQIVAMRTFQISAELRERHGYPEITDAIRRKIFGLNAAAVYGVDPAAVRCVIAEDDLGQLRKAHRADPAAVPVPREQHYGPRTRREFLAFRRWERWAERGGG